MFVGRSHELAFLEEKYSEDTTQVIVIYGRHRVGKTTLATEFLKGKEGVYFLAQKNSFQPQRLTDKFAKEHNIFPKRTETFEETFSFINENIDGRFIIILDEFPYLVEEDSSVPSQFQYIIDEILSPNIFLILQGSSIAMMEDEVLAYKSPLYGRRTGQIKLAPFSFHELIEFFPKKSMEELIEIYGVFDTIPAYLKLVDKSKNIFQNITENLLEKESFLFEEAEFLLRQELREPKKYQEILRAISNGKKRLSHIADEAGILPNVLTKYLESLLTLGIIKKVYPLSEKELRRNTIYDFNDNYLRFYFHFIYPNRTLIEERREKELLHMIKKGFPSYMGPVFEEACRAYLRKFYNRVGPYWNKDIEIDAIALNGKTAVVECKYKEVDADRIRSRMKEKKTPFKPDQYLVMAKGFTSGEGIDLTQMYKAFSE